MIGSSVLDKYSTCLSECEGHSAADTFTADLLYPPEITGTSLISRFAAAAYVTDKPRGKILFHIYFAQHRLTDHLTVLYRQTQENRQPVFCSVLIFTGAAYSHIIPAAAPVLRYALAEAMDPLGYDIKMQVLTLIYHVPAALPPLIRFFKKEVRGHTGEYYAVLSGKLVLSLSVLFQRKIIIPCFRNDRSVLSDTFVPAVNIAIRTAFTYFVTAMPRIPYCHFIAPLLLRLQAPDR